MKNAAISVEIQTDFCEHTRDSDIYTNLNPECQAWTLKPLSHVIYKRPGPIAGPYSLHHKDIELDPSSSEKIARKEIIPIYPSLHESFLRKQGSTNRDFKGDA